MAEMTLVERGTDHPTLSSEICTWQKKRAQRRWPIPFALANSGNIVRQSIHSVDHVFFFSLTFREFRSRYSEAIARHLRLHALVLQLWRNFGINMEITR